MKSYTVEKVMTWGLVHDKDYGGFRLPVCFKKEEAIVKEIQKLVKKYKTNRVFYGDTKTVYFKIWRLLEGQRETLLNTGEQFVDITFDVEDEPMESKRGKLYIKLTLTGLRISENSKELLSKEELTRAPKEDF